MTTWTMVSPLSLPVDMRDPFSFQGVRLTKGRPWLDIEFDPIAVKSRYRQGTPESGLDKGDRGAKVKVEPVALEEGMRGDLDVEDDVTS